MKPPQLKIWLRAAFHAVGGSALLRQTRVRDARIVTYHRFPTASSQLVDQHCAYLQRHYHPLPLTSLVAGLLGERPLPPRAVAVTVDDGYRDVYDVAFPLFQKHGISATVFLATGFLDREHWLWGDRVRYVLSRSALLTSAQERESAIARFKQEVKLLADSERRSLVAALPEQHGVALPGEWPEECAPLTWDQVRAMRRAGMEFGAHTVTHPILSRLDGKDALVHEISGSKRRIEQELGQTVDIFCYPNGRFIDIGDQAMRVVAESGFRAAVTTESGRNRPGIDPLLLRRISVDASDSPLYFRERVAEL